MELVIINGNGNGDHDVAAHRAGCQDVAKATRGHEHYTEEYASRRAAWLDYNADFLAEGSGAWPIHFHNCTKGIPAGGSFNTETDETPAEDPAPALAELEAESAEIAVLSAEREAELQAEQPAGAGLDISARIIGLDPAAAAAEIESELETTQRPRTVNQINSISRQLQARLNRAVQRGGAANLYRITVKPWAAAGRFDIRLERHADDATIAAGSAGHDVTAAELYRVGAEVFHAGIAAELEAILQETRPRTAAGLPVCATREQAAAAAAGARA